MSFIDNDKSDPANQAPAAEAPTGARLVPRITIQAFCEQSQTAQMIEDAAHDRRMAKVALTTHNGGLEGAVETYRSNPTPNLIIVETTLPSETMLAGLERLAEVCDASTRVIVIGHVNDVVLYRELMRSGVSDYIVMPATTPVLVNAISELFAGEGAAPIGRTIAFIGAKGGAGSSSIAHNTAWSIARAIRQDVLVLDLDLPFGTVGLDFNQDPPQGMGDAVFANEKMDVVMLERLMSKAAAHVHLLTAPAVLDRTYDLSERSFEQIIELSQKQVPCVILDIPHVWTEWVRYTLAAVDEIVIVAEPDLANLRNAKNIADIVKGLRPGEHEPLLVINKAGIPKRPEIPADEFAGAVECRLIGQIPFDAAIFGTAANNGQMISEVSATHKINDQLKTIGLEATGRTISAPQSRSAGFKLPDLLRQLKRA